MCQCECRRAVQRRRYLPAELRGDLYSLSSPRRGYLLNWSYQAVAEYGRVAREKISPVRQPELFGWLRLPDEDIFPDRGLHCGRRRESIRRKKRMAKLSAILFY